MKSARLVLGVFDTQIDPRDTIPLEMNMRILVASGMASLTIVGAMYLAYSV